MKHILTVAKKEFIDTLRDRRTMMMMVIMPVFLFPGIFYLTNKLISSEQEKAAEKVLKIGWIGTEQGSRLQEAIQQFPNTKLITGISVEDTASLIREDSLDLILYPSSAFDQQLDSMESGQLAMYYETSTTNGIRRRGEAILNVYEETVLAERLQALQISKQNIEPLTVERHDVATDRQVIGQLVGGFVPYIFLIFSFLGCMYPGIDLFAGEKERGTIETLLTAPVDRIQLMIGKMIVVAGAGFLSALIAMLSTAISIGFMDMGPEIKDAVSGIAQPGNVALIIAMVVPLAIFFAGIIISLSIYARSFKEAQSMITPMNFVVIFPAIIGMLPIGIELDYTTALIPILNVALAAKGIISGTAETLPLILVFVSLIVLAALSVGFSVRWFTNERNVLRS